jgi:hypothetical protein
VEEEMSAQNIYNKLREAGLTHAGACGMLGNLMAESSLRTNNAQDGMTSLSDAGYTEKFDSDPVSCYKDGVGYGLAQWTLWTRKKALAEFANSRGVSIADEDMQVDFAVHELRTDFSGLFSFLCQTDDMYAATDRICREFERPAVNNVVKRYELAQVFDRDLRDARPVEAPYFPPDLSILILQTVLVGNGYNTELTGYKNENFLQTLREFVKDIGG